MSGPEACDGCLARSALVSSLSGSIERALNGRGRGAARELLALGDADLRAALGADRKPGAAAPAKMSAAARAAPVRERVASAGCWACCRHGSGYPAALSDLGDAPAAIFGRGDPAVLAGPDRLVTVVGSRRRSSYGRERAQLLARELSQAGMTIVSGMAIGVDADAHAGALSAGRATIAVLGSGPDVPTPPRMSRLYGEIAASGAVISELPPGTQARRWTFPARNRIMAALSAMTVVVEARVRSGSLITATMATELGREVGAVPGRVGEPCADGANALIADGAHLIAGGQDVLDALIGAGATVPAAARGAVGPAGGGSGPDAEARALLDAVEREGGTPDSLARELGCSPGALAGALARLELLGLVEADSAGHYRRRASR